MSIKWLNEQRNISDLIPADYNPRKLTEKQAKDLSTSIDRFDLVDPIVINTDNKIIGGHQRIKILLDNGVSTVDVRVPNKKLTEKQEKELNLRLNKNLGEWDFDLLADFDMDVLMDVGFDSAELDSIFEVEPDEKDDEVPETPEVAITKPGDIYILGRHRLMCGDSTKIDDVEKLMDGKKADMVFTDPPYGMKKEKEGVLNDNLNYDDLLEFNKKWIPLTFDNLKGNGSWYCWGMDEPLMDIYSNILKPMQKQNKITFRNLITWNKSYLKNGNTFNPFGASGSDNLRSYPTADEKCLFVMCGVQGFNNNSDNYFEGYEPIRKYLEGEATKVNLDGKKLKEICGVGMYSHWFTKSQWNLMKEEYYKKIQNYYQGQAFKKEYQELKKEYQELKNKWYETRAYFTNADESNNVWNIEITKGQEKEDAGEHATPKPIALCSRAIKSSSREGEIVLDLFGGSGSTLIACEKTNRICYGMELDPKYCDVIVKRWEEYTGQKAILA